NNGRDEIFKIRQQERDQSFLRRFLNQELCEELYLFNYKMRGIDIVVTEVADEEGWKIIRDELANMVGLGMVPEIRPQDVENGV
ncbi:SpoVR family protein, partial [Klebsiella pneumoniae]|nr:SpoVR family protein [Klebsiella pneumoniae]